MTYYFSKQFKSVIHCELNADLSKIVKHNFKVLKALISNVIKAIANKS